MLQVQGQGWSGSGLSGWGEWRAGVMGTQTAVPSCPRAHWETFEDKGCPCVQAGIAQPTQEMADVLCRLPAVQQAARWARVKWRRSGHTACSLVLLLESSEPQGREPSGLLAKERGTCGSIGGRLAGARVTDHADSLCQ